MAEKTVILRPVASAKGNGTPTLFPPETTIENAYLLVNEVVADDDATYILCSSTTIGVDLSFVLPTERNIKKVLTHIRVKSDGTDRAADVGLRAYPSDGSSLSSVGTGAYPSAPGTGGWEDYEVDFSDHVKLLEAINNSQYITIVADVNGGASKQQDSDKVTMVDTYITQVYLELIYEDGETVTSPLYLRQNGVWVQMGTIYRKEGGAWVESSPDAMSAGDRFALVEVT